jgi:hypothetical protein
MDRRRNPRVAVQLPVQVWGMDAFGQPFMDAATVSNMSTSGLVLHGIRRRVRAGEILDVRMGEKKAEFRVVWVKTTGELGLQSVTALAFLPDSVLSYCSLATAAC